MKTKYLLIPSFIIVLNGCVSVGPDYKQQKLPTPDYSDILKKQTNKVGKASAIDTKSLINWWECFNDPILSKLMDEALIKNLDLREAQALLKQARSQLIVDEADSLPSLDASGSITREKNGGQSNITNTYKTGFDASWEIDTWGANRRTIEATKADIMSEKANVESVKVSIAGEIAQTYVQIRAYQERIRVAYKNIEAQQDTLDMLESKLKAGLSDELSVQQAKYNLEETRSSLPDLYSGLESNMNTLAILTGKIPGELHKELVEVKAIPVAPFDIVTDIPADTLRQRPDIKKAEWDLVAQTAKIGVAQADLYPSFSISGFFGLSATTSSNFFSSSNESWNLIPSINIPIFNRDSIRANIKIQEAKQEQLLIEYENTVLSAIKEIRDALTNYYQEQQKLKSLQATVNAAKNAVEIAQNKYQNGLIDYDSVLDTLRSLYSFENSLATSKGAVTENFIALYKTLGGGWSQSSNTKNEAVDNKVEN